MTAARPSPPRPSDGVLAPLLVALTLASVLMLSVSDHADPDLWGHVRYGADALAAGGLPATTTYSFTAAEQPWINHEWIAEALFALTARAGGGAGLTLLKMILGLATFALVIGVGRGDAGLPVAAVVVMLVAINVSPGWTVRPQILGYAAFALLLVLLDAAFRRASSTALALIPLLFVVWVNVHGGFVAALGVLALYVGCEVVQDAVRHRASAMRTARRGAIVGLASALALLCTPYGRAFVPWLLEAVTLPRPAISEWQPLAPSDVRFVPFVVLVFVVAASWIGSRKPKRVAHGVVLLALAWQSCRHVRHVPFFAIAAGLWISPHAQSLVSRWSRPSAPIGEPARAPAPLRWAAWGACGVLLLSLATRVHSPWVDKRTFPVDALAYMRAHGIAGRLVAHFDWAQYAIYALAPPATLQFDGRFETAYPPSIADMHFDFVLGDEDGRVTAGDPARVLDFDDPELVLLNRRYPAPAAVMRTRDDWVLLYQDGLAALWARRGTYGDPAGAAYVPPGERSVSERLEGGRVPWPAIS